MWWRRRRAEDDFREEISSHLALEQDQLIEDGMTPEEARVAARRAFGSLARAQERFYESHRVMWLDDLRRDVRHGLRALVRRPGFTVVAVLTLSLGIGANAAIFSVVDGVLLRPVAYKDADRIVTLWQRNIRSGEREEGASPANFLDWRRQARAFAEMAAAEPFSHHLTGQAEPEAFRSWRVTAGFFDVLGVAALHGRTFTADEYRPGHQDVVLLSHRLWQRRFGADPRALGQVLRFSGRPHVVVGVMPPEFDFPPGRELWAPKIESERDGQRRGDGWMPVVARLAPGRTLAEAQQEMDGIAARLAREYPQANGERGVAVVPLVEQMVGHVRPALLVLAGAVGLVLLIACVNVANLLLVRGAERERELAIRAALGAGRGRLARQLLTESFLLALAGGLVGVVLADRATAAILALSPGHLPRAAEIGLDARVLGFAVAVSLLTALAFGLLPALQFASPAPADSLTAGGRTQAGRMRPALRQTLVVSEITLALILLVGAGLLVRSFVSLLGVDPGFSTRRALALEVHVWGVARTPQERSAFFEQTLDRIAGLPGVEAAGAVSALPFHDNPISTNAAFAIDGRPAPPPGQEPAADLTNATADYFRAMGIPLRRGRPFSRFDRQDRPSVAVINETMARRFWPGDDPVGARLTVHLFGQRIACEVVGIVGDVRPTGLDSDPRPEMFLHHMQHPYGSMTYVVRTAGDPAAWLPAVKREIWAVNGNLPFTSTWTLDQLVSRSLAERRFILALLGSFALIALVMATVGIYGLISVVTRQRTREIGVRMALGARPGQVLRLVLRQAVLVTAFGIAAGVAGAAALTRYLAGLLYSVRPLDPLTYALVAILFLAVAMLASYLPARRATRVAAVVALRGE